MSKILGTCPEVSRHGGNYGARHIADSLALNLYLNYVKNIRY